VLLVVEDLVLLLFLLVSSVSSITVNELFDAVFEMGVTKRALA
jgi:hypothetical protein